MVWAGAVFFSRREPTGFVRPGGVTKAGALLALSLRSAFFAALRDDSGSTWDGFLIGVRGFGFLRFPGRFDFLHFAGLPHFCLAFTDLAVVDFIGAFDFKADFVTRRLHVLGAGTLDSLRRSGSTGDVGGAFGDLDSAGPPRSVCQASTRWRNFDLGQLSMLGLYFRRKKLTIVSNDFSRALFSRLAHSCISPIDFSRALVSRMAHSCRRLACIVGLDSDSGI